MIISTLNLPVLFARMEWPSLLVRELAASQIVALLEKPETCQETGPALVEWLATRKLESLAANVLLIPLRIKADGAEVTPDIENYAGAIGCPSVLSHLLFNEIRDDRRVPMAWKDWHSGSAPRSIDIDPYFERYKKSFVPEIYDLRAEQLERDFMMPFRRQWAYEFQHIFERTRLPKSGPPHYFLDGVHSEDKRCLFDVPQSEAFRSAFLRGLAWAVDVAGLPEIDAKIFALQSCPLDIGCWRVKPTTGPDWWPSVHSATTGLDSTPGDIWRQVEGLWQQQVKAGTSEILVHASGHVFADKTTISDLVIFGAFQKFRGGADPPIEEIARWLNGYHIVRPESITPTIEGKVESEPIADHIRQFEGWSLTPAAFKLMSRASARWQADRTLVRGIWMPPPYLVSGAYSILSTNEMLKVYQGDRAIARWVTWNDHLSEDWYRNIPPPVGECLWVERDKIDKFCEQNQVNFCWSVRQRFYCRQYTYKPFEMIEITNALGASHILR